MFKELSKTQKRCLISIFILMSVTQLGNVLTPLLAYIADSYPGVDRASVQQLMGIPSLIGLAVTFAIGPIALKVNKNSLLLLTVLSVAIMLIGFSIVGAVKAPFYCLVILSAISGISRGGTITLMNSIIAEYIPGSIRARCVAINSSLQMAGATLASSLGGIIGAGNSGADWYKAAYLGYLTIPAMIAFMLFMPKHPDESDMLAAGVSGADPGGFRRGPGGPGGGPGEPMGADPVAEQKRGIKAIPATVYILIGVMLLFSIALVAYLYNISFYVISEHQLGTSVEAGFISSSYTLTGFLAGFLYPFFDKALKKWLMPTAISFSAVALLILRFVTSSIASPFAAAIFMGLAFRLMAPCLTARVMEVTPRKYVPVAMSIAMGGSNLAMFAAPTILALGGRLFGGGLNAELIFGFVIAAATVAVCVLLFPLAKQKTDANA